MKEKNKIKLFEQQSIRTHWDEEQEQWLFSVVDVVGVLTGSPRPRKYWNALKTKLNDEGSQLSHDMGQLKMPASDGKLRLTDVANTKQLLRLIQSIPSPKAEPFKQWLAEVGAQRIDETDDPELAFDRAMQTYLAKGYSKEWINQRLKSIEVRKDLTDEWAERGMQQGLEYAILTQTRRRRLRHVCIPTRERGNERNKPVSQLLAVTMHGSYWVVKKMDKHPIPRSHALRGNADRMQKIEARMHSHAPAWEREILRNIQGLL